MCLQCKGDCLRGTIPLQRGTTLILHSVIIIYFFQSLLFFLISWYRFIAISLKQKSLYCFRVSDAIHLHHTILTLFKKITHHFTNLSRTVLGKNDNLDEELLFFAEGWCILRFENIFPIIVVLFCIYDTPDFPLWFAVDVGLHAEMFLFKTMTFKLPI
jgi:hypothetical protein